MRIRCPQLAGHNPSMSTGSLSQLLGQEWSLMSRSQKAPAPWKELSEHCMRAFERKFPTYHDRCPPTRQACPLQFSAHLDWIPSSGEASTAMAAIHASVPAPRRQQSPYTACSSVDETSTSLHTWPPIGWKGTQHVCGHCGAVNEYPGYPSNHPSS